LSIEWLPHAYSVESLGRTRLCTTSTAIALTTRTWSCARRNITSIYTLACAPIPTGHNSRG